MHFAAAHDVVFAGGGIGIAAARIEPQIRDERGDFWRCFENGVGAVLRQVSAFAKGLDGAAHPPARFVQGDGYVLLAQPECRAKSRDSTADDCNRVHMDLEKRSPLSLPE